METKATPWWRGQIPTAVLMFIIAALAVWVIATGIGAASGVAPMNVVKGAILVVVGFIAGLLGGLIGTGGCSVMLPIIHFWMGYPAAIAVGTTLFAVIFTALSGGYGHLVQRNVDARAFLWLGGSGIVGVLLGSWLFTLLSGQAKLLGLILGLIFLWPALRMIYEGVIQRGIPKREGASIGGSGWGMAVFGFTVGIATGVAGLGGGYALVPGLIYLFGAAAENALPGTLPDGYTFGSGYTESVVGAANGIIPNGGTAELSLVVPEGKTPVIFYWDAGESKWVEVPVAGSEGSFSASDSGMQVLSGVSSSGGMAHFTVNFTGTFIVVYK